MLKDDRGWIDYVLSSTGILFAGSILLLAICGVFRLTIPSDEQILLQGAAAEIANQIEGVDLKPFPCKQGFGLGEGYDVTISSEYITVSRPGSDKKYIRTLVARVYPARNIFWNNTSEMREYLKKEFGHSGSKEDRLDACNATNLSRVFYAIALNTSLNLGHSKRVLLEKEFIYFEDSERRGYVFIDQE